MLLHHAFVHTAKQHWSKQAIVDRATDRTLTYGRVLTASLILARRFRSLPGAHLGIMLPTSAGGMLSVLGAVMAGKVPVMINYASGAEENCAYAQTTCEFQTIITARRLLAKVACPEVPGMLFLEDVMAGLSAYEKLRAAFKARLPASWITAGLAPAREDDPVVVLFTSGSEKAPKAVPLTHRNIGSNIRATVDRLELSAADRVACILPLFHVFGYNVNGWLPLIQGMTAVAYANPLDFEMVPRIVREEGATVLAGTPLFLKAYLEGAAPGDLASLRLLIAGADRVPDALRQAYQEKHGLTLLEGYGTTETSPVVCVNTPGDNRPGSIGRPLAGVDVRIADVETHADLPPGEEGKILVKGDLVMSGYLNAPEENAERLRDGWYDTGDMGVCDEDGFFWHRGRLRRFVKMGGEMVSLVRTESALESVLPEGVACCVVDVPDDRKGAQLIAAVTREVDKPVMLKALADKLPAFALPKRFVVIPQLPMTGSRKVDFRAVGELVRAKLAGGQA